MLRIASAEGERITMRTSQSTRNTRAWSLTKREYTPNTLPIDATGAHHGLAHLTRNKTYLLEKAKRCGNKGGTREYMLGRFVPDIFSFF